MSGCKCGPSTRRKLFLHGPSVTWNWKRTGNRYSLPTESFVGPPSTCLMSKTCVREASGKDTQARLDVLDTILYTTILDAFALRLHPKQCICCKSFDHLVRYCPFLVQEKPQEEANSTLKTSANGTSTIDSWKLQKWFTTAGQEGCNLYQRKRCKIGEACKRAHMCKACRGTTPRPIARPVHFWL